MADCQHVVWPESRDLKLTGASKFCTLTNPSPVGYYFDVSNNIVGLKKFSIFHILIIATLAIGLYSNTLKNGFVYDDEFTIVDNTLVKNFDNLPLLFDKTAYFRGFEEISYRPVVTLTYFIDYALYGLNPLGYHLTNILLHAINGALLYFLLNLLLTPGTVPILRRSEAISVNRDSPLSYSSRFTSPAFLISILFVSHPVLTEAVNCISYREDLLVFLFYVTTLSLYLILRKPTTDRRPLTTALLYLLSCLTYLLALFSKEMAVTLPFIVICHEWLYGKEKTKLHSRLFNSYSVGYIIITFFYLYIRFNLFHNPEEQIEAWSLVERFLTLPWLIMSYIKLSFIPVHLSANYVINPVSSPFSPLFILPIIALISLFTIILLYSPFNKGGHKRFPPLAKGSEGGFENGFLGRRSILFGTLFFLIALTPVYNLVPVDNPLAERYLYLPLVGFIMSTVCITYLIAEKLKISPAHGNRYMPIVFLFVLIILSFSVVKRNTLWRDNYSLWSDTVAKMPNSSRAHNNLGFVYYNLGRIDEAIREYRTAIKLRFKYKTALHVDSNNAITHHNLGNAYYRKGQKIEALQEYITAIKLKPDYSDPHYSLGSVYFDLGMLTDAIQEYSIAIELKPSNVIARYSLGIALAKKGLRAEARKELETVLKLAPSFIEARKRLETLD